MMLAFPLPVDIVDKATFEQLLEMDQDEPGFSECLVSNFFQQVDSTLEEMRISLKRRDLPSLCRQGHFLKGSAAALGVIKVKQSFEMIQFLTLGMDEFGQGTCDADDALRRISHILDDVNNYVIEAKLAFNKFFTF